MPTHSNLLVVGFHLDGDLASVEEVDDSVEVVLGVVRQDQLDPGAADQALQRHFPPHASNVPRQLVQLLKHHFL